MVLELESGSDTELTEDWEAEVEGEGEGQGEEETECEGESQRKGGGGGGRLLQTSLAVRRESMPYTYKKYHTLIREV